MAKKSKILIIAGLLLLAAALLIILYNAYTNKAGREASEQALENIVVQIDDAVKKNTDLVESAQRELDAKGKTDAKVEDYVLPDYVLNPRMDMHTVEVDGHEYIGVLSIPSIEIDLPVMSEWSYPNLKLGPCRYTGTIYRHNMVILAHNYVSFFGKLKDLSYGDELSFTDADGNVFSYQVIEVETLPPTAIEEMRTGDWDLTVFTCTKGGRARVTVRCELVEEKPAGF